MNLKYTIRQIASKRKMPIINKTALLHISLVCILLSILLMPGKRDSNSLAYNKQFKEIIELAYI